MALLQARLKQARSRFEAFTAGAVALMVGEMAQQAAQQSLSTAAALDGTRCSVPLSSIRKPAVDQEKSYSSGWEQDVSGLCSGPDGT
jgi:hypothetical protein